MLVSGPAWIPPVDLYETNTEFVMEVSLGGIAPEEVHVEVEGRRVRIWGERLGGSGEGVRCYHAMEIERGTFDRTIDLTMPVDARTAKATFRDGLLELHITKLEGGGFHGCFSADSMEGLE
jgi:HSP20 family protein